MRLSCVSFLRNEVAQLFLSPWQPNCHASGFCELCTTKEPKSIPGKLQCSYDLIVCVSYFNQLIETMLHAHSLVSPVRDEAVVTQVAVVTTSLGPVDDDAVTSLGETFKSIWGVSRKRFRSAPRILENFQSYTHTCTHTQTHRHTDTHTHTHTQSTQYRAQSQHNTKTPVALFWQEKLATYLCPLKPVLPEHCSHKVLVDQRTTVAPRGIYRRDAEGGGGNLGLGRC